MLMPEYRPPTRQKRPNDDLTYTFDFTQWPQFLDDPISSAAVVSTPSGLTVGAPAVDVDGRKVQVRLASGVAATTYTLTCTSTTAAGYDVVGDGYLEVVAPT